SLGQIMNSTPCALGAPDAGAQRLQLHDLAVVDEQVDIVAVVFDIPFEYFGVRGLEHDFVESDLVDDPCYYVGAPAPDVLGDALAFDHDDIRPGIECALCLDDEPAYVPGTL